MVHPRYDSYLSITVRPLDFSDGGESCPAYLPIPAAPIPGRADPSYMDRSRGCPPTGISFWRRLFAVLFGDVLLDELRADADVVERPIVVGDVGRTHDFGPVPVLDLPVHVQDPDLELAVR
jgi:hypothetical protein